MDDFDYMYQDDLGPLYQLATALHQMYINLRKAGFNEQQALYLTSKLVTKAEDSDIQIEGE
jgi:hypothetical protein